MVKGNVCEVLWSFVVFLWRNRDICAKKCISLTHAFVAPTFLRFPRGCLPMNRIYGAASGQIYPKFHMLIEEE